MLPFSEVRTARTSQQATTPSTSASAIRMYAAVRWRRQARTTNTISATPAERLARAISMNVDESPGSRSSVSPPIVRTATRITPPSVCTAPAIARNTRPRGSTCGIAGGIRALAGDAVGAGVTCATGAAAGWSAGGREAVTPAESMRAGIAGMPPRGRRRRPGMRSSRSRRSEEIQPNGLDLVWTDERPGHGSEVAEDDPGVWLHLELRVPGFRKRVRQDQIAVRRTPITNGEISTGRVCDPPGPSTTTRITTPSGDDLGS